MKQSVLMNNRCFMKIFFIIILTLNFSLICLSQSISKTDDFRLIQTRPSAYITFEKFVTREPRFIGENKEKILLRFHNNTKWNLKISTLSCKTLEDECFVFYEIKLRNELNFEGNKSDFPRRNRVKHVAATKTINSGKSLLFTVPREDLATGLYILLEFSYEWEASGNGGDGSGYIFHQVPFYSENLPKEKNN